jgi:hypothetical protein
MEELETIVRKRLRMFVELSDIVTRYCIMEDAWLANLRYKNLRQEQPEPGEDGKCPHHSRRPKRSSTDRSDDQPAGRKKTTRQGTQSALHAILDQPCAIHSISSGKSPTHRFRACSIVKQVEKGGVELLENLGVLTS